MAVPEERLDADLQALLDAERAAPNPPADVQARVWANVEANIAAGVSGAATTPTTTSAAGGGVAAGKWVAAAALVAAGTVAGVFSMSEQPAEAPPAEPGAAIVADEEPAATPTPQVIPEVAAPAAEPVAPANDERAKLTDNAATQPVADEQAADRAAERAVIADPVADPAAKPAEANVKPRQVVQRATEPAEPVAPSPGQDDPGVAEPGDSAAAAAPTAPSAADLKLELGHLRSARKMLVAGNPAASLRHVNAHAAAFPRGQLAEERDALRVQALAALGRHDEALQRAGAFRRDYPGSLMWTAVKNAVSSAADR